MMTIIGFTGSPDAQKCALYLYYRIILQKLRLARSTSLAFNDEILHQSYNFFPELQVLFCTSGH